MKRDDERKAVASLIYFSDHVTKDRVEQWIEKLKEQGHVVASDTREYKPAYGEPCWYIP